MALNLSTLTSPATSGDVLAEALTTADFLEGVPVLRNLARGSQKGGDAKQDVALNQPKALPLIDGDGYLYLSSPINNYASTPDSSELDVTGDITIECDFIVPEYPVSVRRVLVAKYNTNTGNRSYQLYLNAGFVGFILSPDGAYNSNYDKTRDFSSVLSGKTRATIKVTWRQSDGRTQFFIKESDGSFTQVGVNHSIAISSIYNGNQEVEIGSQNSGATFTGSPVGFFGARIYASINDTNKVLDVDFTATTVRHGDTKFKCATGQVVTINQSGNDPATIIKKPVLRFDGADDNLKGLLGTTVTEGYAFLAFSVLGGGGEQFATCFGLNSTGGATISTDGYGITHRNSERLQSFNSNVALDHQGLFDDANGDILHEVKFTSGSQISKINNADQLSSSTTTTISSEEFSIAERVTNGLNTAFDLEYLALFPATITDAQADSVRNFINNRNNVFSLVDGFGYYFFDPQSITDSDLSGATNRLTGSWEGRIVGSDNGDTSRSAYNGTEDDQPTSNKYTLTFADNTDNLSFSISQAGWQIVGTSLGTFAYRVNNTAVTELNILGNLGNSLFRKAGQSYGMILLPESATGADIEEARKLLIDRGAADGASAGSFFAAWAYRADIVNFKFINTTSVTAAHSAWWQCSNLEEFPALDLSNSNRFESAWKNCSALTSFPAGAKLGTAASSGVNFNAAWKSSGLTSFPALDLSKGNNFSSAFQSSDLTSFPAGIDMSNGTNFANTWRDTDIVEFPLIDLDKSSIFLGTWRFNNLMTTFPAGFFDTWNPNSMNNYVFQYAFSGCVSLTSESVQNILVSINASGQYPTSDGNAGSSAITYKGIDIDYDGTTLSAATDSAITSLRGKSWVVYINGVERIP